MMSRFFIDAQVTRNNTTVISAWYPSGALGGSGDVDAPPNWHGAGSPLTPEVTQFIIPSGALNARLMNRLLLVEISYKLLRTKEERT
jgi:hypothetical protein